MEIMFSCCVYLSFCLSVATAPCAVTAAHAVAITLQKKELQLIICSQKNAFQLLFCENFLCRGNALCKHVLVYLRLTISPSSNRQHSEIDDCRHTLLSEHSSCVLDRNSCPKLTANTEFLKALFLGRCYAPCTYHQSPAQSVRLGLTTDSTLMTHSCTWH